MKPFFQYMGCKRREIPIIEKYLPGQYSKFVDVFGGSGAVILSQMNDLTREYHYNDINPILVKIFRHITETPEAFAAELSALEVNPENNLKVMRKELNLSPEVQFLWSGYVGMLGMRNCGYVNTRNKFAAGANLSAKFDVIGYSKQFEDFDFRATGDDFRRVMGQYKDNPDAFLYLDPPYVSKNTDDYGIRFTVDDIMFIREFITQCKCKVMLNIDYTGFTRETFSAYYKFGYPVNYNARAQSKTKNDIYGKYHIIATNY